MTPSQVALEALDESLSEYRRARRKGTTDLDPQTWLVQHVKPATLAVLDEDVSPCERSDCDPATCASRKHDR